MHNRTSRLLMLILKPYNLLGLGAFLVFAGSLFAGNQAFDLNIQDTYIVVEGINIYYLLDALLLLLWLIYFISDRILLSKKLMWIHVAVSLFSIFVFFFVLNTHSLFELPRRPYYAVTEFHDMDDHKVLAISFLVIFLVMITGQVLFLVNVFGGLIRRFFRSSDRNS